MPVINNEGKIFNKINIVDLLIILALLGGTYAGYLVLFGEINDVYVTVLAENQPSWIYNNIHAGDTEVGYFTGRIMGEVVDIQTIPSLTKEKTMAVVMKIRASKKNGVLYYKDKIVKIGRPIEVSTDLVSFDGTIISMGQSAKKDFIVDDPKTIALRFENVPAVISGQINAGKISDESGNVLMEITDISKSPSSLRNYNITLKAVVGSKKMDNQTVFGNDYLRVESPFTIQTDKISLTGQIMEILPPQEEYQLLDSHSKMKIVDLDLGNVSLETFKGISKGFVEKNSDGIEISKILNIEMEYINERQQKIRLQAEIETEQFKGDTLHKNSEISIGNELTIDTQYAYLFGTIVGIYDLAKDLPASGMQSVRTVSLVSRNVSPWIADKISVGDEEIDLQTGKAVVKILSKGVAPAEIVTTTIDGKILNELHPINKDVTLTAELLLEKDEYGNLLFKGNPVKVDSGVYLKLPEVNIGATITEIKNG